MKRIAIITLALAAVSGAFAQKGVEDGSRYGHGQDSIDAVRNIVVYTDYVKLENYQEAYERGWKNVFRDAPFASMNTYTNGVKILRWMYKNEQDAEKKAQFSKELMEVYEQRLKYLDKLNALQASLNNKPTPEHEVMTAYAHDFIAYNPKPSLATAYDLLRKSVTMAKGKAPYYVLDDLMKISLQRYNSNKTSDEYREALMQDYIDCSTYIDEFIASQTNEKILEQSAKAKENIDGYFIKSGVADCETLQSIYGSKIEEHKDDVEYLNKVVRLMSLFDCKSSDAYFTAAEYAHQLSPSVQTARSLGALYLQQRGDAQKSISYYEQAADLEEDKSEKSDIYMTMAQIWLSEKNYDKCRACVNKSIANNPNNGNSYILLASLYAIKCEWNDNPTMNSCAYFAVLDKLEQAKRVDPAVTEKANSMIAQYKKLCPKPEDLFMFNLKVGQSLEIKGWINETTTIR